MAACPLPTAVTLHVLVRERQFDDALDRYAVIRQQQLVRHGYHDTLSGHSGMIPLRLRPRLLLVTCFDAGLIIFASAALVIALGGRTRVDLAGLRLTLRGPLNPLLIAAACAVLRLAAGWRLPFLPIAPRADPSRLDAERDRLARGGPATREVWIYAGLTLIGSLVWIVPHLTHLRSVPDPGDPLYSAWSIARLVHQLTTDPRHLFDGNIFYPLPRTLTYSDMRFLEAFVGAPFSDRRRRSADRVQLADACRVSGRAGWRASTPAGG